MTTHAKLHHTTLAPAIGHGPADAAKQAGLRYVSDTTPGITRKRAGAGWSYRTPDGALIHDTQTLRRIRSLVIPPAWVDVWICPRPNGHIQATGRDAKGRKQYRYHPDWRTTRDETKYARMIAFGQALPRIRERVAHDLALHGLPRAKVLATVVRLLETTLIRVGNEEYAKTNQSYGLTTMQNEHVAVKNATLRFSFRGKSGVHHTIDLKDRRLARIVRQLQDLPGHELFQYYDEDGTLQTVDSADVNAYLFEITGEHLTAKDFRTWAGTTLAAFALHEFEVFDSETQAKQNLVRAVESVAARLGNTPTVCRKCYIHPAVFDAYLDGTMRDTFSQLTAQELADTHAGLPAEEAAVLAFLQGRLAV